MIKKLPGKQDKKQLRPGMPGLLLNKYNIFAVFSAVTGMVLRNLKTVHFIGVVFA
jgi:hypothetical protein